MARGCRRWQAEGGAGVGGNEVGHGLRLHLGHGHSLGLVLIVDLVVVLQILKLFDQWI